MDKYTISDLRKLANNKGFTSKDVFVSVTSLRNFLQQIKKDFDELENLDSSSYQQFCEQIEDKLSE